MKEIPLTKGAVALADDIDYDYLIQWKWHLSSRGYAITSIPTKGGRQQNLSMARVILESQKLHDVEEVDHRNGNKLDNRRQNLRPATHLQNGCNRSKQANNTSGFKGVSWRKDKGKWAAQIWHQGSKKHLGYFHDKVQAAHAYNEAALELHRGVCLSERYTGCGVIGQRTWFGSTGLEVQILSP